MSIELERLMEEKDVPECDRDQLRIFADFLQRRKDAKNGKKIEPLTENDKVWLGLQGGQP